MTLKVHHLNCGSICPYGKRYFNGHGGLFEKAHFVCHCLLIEAPHGLILVDTGIGLDDIQYLNKVLGYAFNKLLLNTVMHESETAIRRIEALGFKANDITDIIVTHLDIDHTGGLSDFPNARVHLYEKEYHAFCNQTFFEKMRYRKTQLAHNPNWVVHDTDGETWEGFESIKPLPNTQDNIAMVPLIGHTRGHCGVVVNSDKGWLLHAGDAYFYHGQLEERPHQPLGIKMLQKFTDTEVMHRKHNQQRLRHMNLNPDNAINIFCSHDPVEFKRFNKIQHTH